MKPGDWVLATKKTPVPDYFDRFLEEFHLGVAKIESVSSYSDLVFVRARSGMRYTFEKEDLVVIQEKK